MSETLLKHALTNPVVKVEPGVSVHEAARMMVSGKVGALIVCQGERMLGIISERDILTKVVAEDLSPLTTTVGQVMTSPVITASSDDAFIDGVRLMIEGNFRHLPLMGNQGAIVGVLSIRDVARDCLRQLEAVVPTAKKKSA